MIKFGSCFCVDMSDEPNDKISNFLDFLMKEEINTAIRSGYSGCGGYLGFFHMDDAEKIENYFKKDKK